MVLQLLTLLGALVLITKAFAIRGKISRYLLYFIGTIRTISDCRKRVRECPLLFCV